MNRTFYFSPSAPPAMDQTCLISQLVDSDTPSPTCSASVLARTFQLLSPATRRDGRHISVLVCGAPVSVTPRASQLCKRLVGYRTELYNNDDSLSSRIRQGLAA
jgi:hypothetical protein